jgi:hypothetical protein
MHAVRQADRWLGGQAKIGVDRMVFFARLLNGRFAPNKRLIRGENCLVKVFRDQPPYAFSRSAMTIFCIFIMACMALSAFFRSGSLR